MEHMSNYLLRKAPSPKLNSADTNRVQSINGTFLYYDQAVYPFMLQSLNEIPTWQYAPTQDTMDKFNQVLDYASTHLNVTIRYHARDMILMTDTDFAYLVPLESRSSIAG